MSWYKSDSVEWSEPHGDSAEHIHVIGRARDTDVAAAIELHVLSHEVLKADVHRANPSRPALRAEIAEEFAIAIKLADDGVVKRDHLGKFRVVARAGVVSKTPGRRFVPHVTPGRQFDCEWQDHSTLHRIIAEMIGVCRELDE